MIPFTVYQEQIMQSFDVIFLLIVSNFHVDEEGMRSGQWLGERNQLTSFTRKTAISKVK